MLFLYLLVTSLYKLSATLLFFLQHSLPSSSIFLPGLFIFGSLSDFPMVEVAVSFFPGSSCWMSSCWPSVVLEPVAFSLVKPFVASFNWLSLPLPRIFLAQLHFPCYQLLCGYISIDHLPFFHTNILSFRILLESTCWHWLIECSSNLWGRQNLGTFSYLCFWVSPFNRSASSSKPNPNRIKLGLSKVYSTRSFAMLCLVCYPWPNP